MQFAFAYHPDIRQAQAMMLAPMMSPMIAPWLFAPAYGAQFADLYWKSCATMMDDLAAIARGEPLVEGMREAVARI